ncbi:uncharacterized protein [Mytilus edulis]|uniref:uncharacterized protein n=1 Tax=Mytilus edulis TaxID=6550 RepID=UPI0039EE5437
MQRILILTFISAVFAESNISIHFDCSKLQFWEREKVQCNASNPIFQCAWDIFSNQYEMKCVRKPILIRIGNRPTIQGGLHFGPCSKDRYQPFHIVSNRTVDCWYLKNYCTEEGQVLCDNRTGGLDRTCRCDYTNGYAFVQSPKNNFSCIPSEEDCSCFKKICSNKFHRINPEYECVESYKAISFTGTCLISDKPPLTTPATDYSSSLSSIKLNSVSDSKESGWVAAVVVVCLVVFAPLLALIILKFGPFCIRRWRMCIGGSYSRANIVSKTEEEEDKHMKDDTYFKTSTINIALEILRSFHTLIIVGLEGSGKSSLCLEIAKHYKDMKFTALMISSSDIKNIIHYIRPNKTDLYILDINLKPGQKDLLKICKDYCKSAKLKFIITTSLNYGNEEVYLDKFEDKQHVRLDPLCREDKVGILGNYMTKFKIKSCENSYESNYEDPVVIKNPEMPVNIYRRILDNIIDTENTFTGFPSACQKFFCNRSLLHLEHRYFNTPPDSVISQINTLRSNTEVFEKIKYVILVYIMMKERTTLTDLKNDDERLKSICHNIDISYSDLKFFLLKDAAKDLERTYLKCASNVFEFNHETMSKAVWMSYTDIDKEYCLLNCPWSYIEDYIRPLKWQVQDYDVCIQVDNSLIFRRLEKELNGGSSWSPCQYLLKCYPSCYEFIDSFCQHYVNKKDVKRDILLNLCSAFSKVGTSFELFTKCVVAKDMLFSCNIDPFNNCLLHYCVLQDYEGMLSNIPDNIFDKYLNTFNRKNHSPCHLEFYFGRKEIVESHIHRIPRTYEYYSKLNKLYHMGERNFGRIIEAKHLNVVGQMDLKSDVVQRAKFGSKLDFILVQDMLLKLKKETITLVRIKQLPTNVDDKNVARVLETFECVIIKQYRERHRQKGRITNIETGDRIVICKAFKKPLPRLIEIAQLEVEIFHEGQLPTKGD